MSWRSAQLKGGICDQDQIILDIFGQRFVNYVGQDDEFKSMLNINSGANSLVLIVNYPVWFSDVVKLCAQHINSNINEVYIGINRYYLLGNDTSYILDSSSEHGIDILNAVKQYAVPAKFKLVRQGTYDNDCGAHFNFVQPLTWMYCASQ